MDADGLQQPADARGRSWSAGSPARAGDRRAPHVVDPLAIDGDGGDSPAWSRKRQPYEAPALIRAGRPRCRYAELHCHTNFSFLDGASHPEELAEEAARLGLTALAVTDHDGFYGVVRFAEAARELGLPTIFGAELSLGLPGPQNGEPDPEGRHLLRARARAGGVRPAGPRHLRRPSSPAGRRAARSTADRRRSPRELRDHVLVLTGCRKGSVPAGAARRRAPSRGRASWTG